MKGLHILAAIFGVIAIILGIFNSDLPEINEFLVHRALSNFVEGVFCLQFKEENNRIIGYGNSPNGLIQGTIISEKNKEICDNIMIINNKIQVYSGFLRGTIGIGETYFNEYWILDGDLGDFITHLFWNILNQNNKYGSYLTYFSLFWWKEYFYMLGITKDQKQDMLDVCHHYFNTQFYKYMLDDETMTYTCALWNQTRIKTLSDAQKYKLNVLIHKLRLDRIKNEYPQSPKKTVQILDVGSGWGYLASTIYNKTNINNNEYNNNNNIYFNITGITISTEQFDYGLEMYGQNIKNYNTISSISGKYFNKELNLLNSPYYFLEDFRNLPNIYGKNYFDRIISVGVISHIHIKRLDEWFDKLYYILKPGGIFVMQGIVGTSAFNNNNNAWIKREYGCQESNFIYKYVFPGGCLLLDHWMHESAVKSGFITMHRDYIGQHYTKTLRYWRHNLYKNKNNIFNHKNINIDKKKYLAYDMYLAQSEAGFRIGKFEKTQFVFYKPLIDNINTKKYENYGDHVELGWQGFDM